MGFFIPRSQVIVANLDEPLDPGVLIEIAHARALGKFVVGFRTDVRSPYGEIASELRGIHFFPAYQCHAFLFFSQSCCDSKDVDGFVNELALRIQNVIESRYSDNGSLWESTGSRELVLIAEELFSGLDVLNSKESLEVIAARYIRMQKRIAAFRPFTE